MNFEPIDRLVLGTAEIGLAYGIPAGGRRRRPSARNAISLLRRAYEGGVRTFDTAPTYGCAEQLLGDALGDARDVRIATKVSSVSTPHRDLEQSLENSLTRLRRSSVHLVQWHNLGISEARSNVVSKAMTGLRGGGAQHLGASTYGKRAALEAIKTGWVEYLQVEFSLLNQDVLDEIVDEARTRAVSLWARSVLLQGVLAGRWRDLPERLALLRCQASKAEDIAAQSGLTIAEASLRFAFGRDELAGILVGVDRVGQLRTALRAGKEGSLPSGVAAQLGSLNLGEVPITDPSTWNL